MAYQIVVIVTIALMCGCSPGLVGSRSFTGDSCYLVWQDINYGLPCASNFAVKRTKCANGETVLVDHGDFIMDNTGRYILVFPIADKDTRVTLIRVEDRKCSRLESMPGADNMTPADSIIDFSLEAFEPPRFHCCLVHESKKQFTLYEYGATGWQIVKSGEATEQQLAAATRLQSQKAFIDEQVKTRKKETPSPDGRYILFESTQPYHHHAELRQNGGKRSFLLTTQTDQFWEGLTRFGEWLYYGKYANSP